MKHGTVDTLPIIPGNRDYLRQLNTHKSLESDVLGSEGKNDMPENSWQFIHALFQGKTVVAIPFAAYFRSDEGEGDLTWMNHLQNDRVTQSQNS